ncbi:aminodeoxychorismate synthase component I [Streptomyces cyaneofuscatus]|uniref:aminodeoxychorismate synthase component I n=1 Tax=Streptomyces cyaneofuscatus TaxID=66883 RepID=UPI0036542902
MRTLLIDNHDSFTYNLYDLLHRVNGRAPEVVTNDTPWSDTAFDTFDSIVVSPGPGRPQHTGDLGLSLAALRQSAIPTLGICLGHQGLSHVNGGRVVHAPEPMHGRVSDVHHSGTGLFAGMPSPFTAVRYHSLAVTDLPAGMEAIAWTADGVMMGARHRTAPQWGVQFHPESILTEYGVELLDNFRSLVSEWRQGPRSVRPGGSERGRYQLEHRRIGLVPDTESLFGELYGTSPAAFWLDSAGGSDQARFTMMGDDSGPLAEHLAYSVPDGTWTITRSGRTTTVQQGWFEYLGGQLAERRTAHPPQLPSDFNLGYVGVLGYELKAETHGRAHHVSPLPDGQLIFADRAVVVDHQDGATHLLALTDPSAPRTVPAAAEWLAETTRALRRHAACTTPASGPEPSGSPLAPEGTADLRRTFTLDQSRTEYLDSIGSCLSAITDGESYEICLTNTAEAEPLRDPLGTYSTLRALSPVPFGAYLRMREVSLLSASPERFLSVRRDGRVQAKPIKGTRPRGSTAEADLETRRELARNAKDRAENLMIVDLLRNDLNRVCMVGSVHVSKMFDVETYSHVHQLVSTVQGRLQPGRTVMDCVRATFPGGSMTGAPKVRTMEIIDQLEHRARGYYSGAIGWFSLSGAADLSIVIRTLVNSPKACTFGVGGAIIALSDPDAEYEETLVKSRAVLAASQGSLGQAAPDEVGRR